MADLRQIGQALSGLGAGVGGEGIAFQGQLDERRRMLDEERSQAVLEDAFKIQRLLTPGPDQNVPGAQDVLLQRFDAIRQLGGDPSDSLAVLNKLDAGDITGALQDVTTVVDFGIRTERLTDPRDLIPANQRSFESLIAGFSDTDKVSARRIKAGIDPRAIGSAEQTITDKAIADLVAVTRATLTEGAESGKLTAQLKLKPQVESAVTSAVENAKDLADQAVLDKTNASTFAIYDVGMRGLMSGLDNTLTGPFVGMLPALTTNSQIANGAIAAILPILKTLFRAAGEGIFTDKDQELLTAMIPTRRTKPAARIVLLENVDAIIREKLGQPLAGDAGQGGDTLNFDAQGNIIP